MLNRITFAIFIFLSVSPVFNISWAYSFEIVEKKWDEIKGAQVFVLPDTDIDGYFATLKSHGINTVFFRVFHNNFDRTHMYKHNPCPSGGVYFNTGKACVVDNLLEEVTASARKNQIKIYAWMATRSLTFLKNKSMALSFSPTGKKSGYGANLFDKKITGDIKALIKDLATYDLDGILIQDDFIYKYSEGADIFACSAFRLETGEECSVQNLFGDNSGTNIFSNRGEGYGKWISWKAQKLQKLLLDIRDETRLINPSLKWAVNIYYETPVYPQKGLSWYSQDLGLLWSAGIDYIAVMAYEEQIKNEIGIGGTDYYSFIKELAKSSIKSAPEQNGSRTIFKLQVKSFKNGSKLSRPDFIKTCEEIKNAGGKSFVQLPVVTTGDLFSGCGF